MFHELMTEEVPQSLTTILDTDWLLVISRTLAPTGMMSASVLMEMDRIIDLPAKDRPSAFKEFMDGIASQASTDGGHVKDANDDVFTFDD